MNSLVILSLAMLAAVNAAPSLSHGGAIVAGPAGVVTSHGAVGPALGLGLGHGALLQGPLGHGALLAGPVAHGAVIAGPVAHGALLTGPVAHGALVAGPLAHGAVWGAAPLVAGPLGASVVTNGGGVVGVSAHGAHVSGPHTAPVVVAGPAGKIVAQGLWGPTHNVGLAHHNVGVHVL